MPQIPSVMHVFWQASYVQTYLKRDVRNLRNLDDLARFQVFLRPYHANIGKRLIKSPKVYFADTGLLCYLVGLHDVAHAAAGPMGKV